MKNYIPSLNGLRAISILIVILGHLNHKSFGNQHFPFPFTLLIDSGFGVNVFFVISGFLITTLLIKEETDFGKISLKDFYVRRVFRIFPAYYFLLLVYFVLQLCSVLYFTKDSWLSSIFYYKYLSSSGDWETGHFWSLSVEEQFYLVWPLVFIYFKKLRVWFAFAVVVMVMFFRYNAYAKFFPAPVLSLDVSLFQRVDAIMIGCLLALYKDKVIQFSARFSGYGWASAAILLLIAFLNSDYPTAWNMNHHLHLGLLIIPLGIGSSSGLLTNLLIALLVVVSICGHNSWFRFLNHRFMNYLGLLSYSLYLWQQLFFSKHIGVLSHFPINVCCIVCCALFSFYIIERPFLKLKKRFEAAKNPGKSRLVLTIPS